MLIFLFMFLLFIAMYLVNKVVCVNDKLKIGQFANVLNRTDYWNWLCGIQERVNLPLNNIRPAPAIRLWADLRRVLNVFNNNNNNNNMWIYKAHDVSKQAESEAPKQLQSYYKPISEQRIAHTVT